jgi:sugar phosphate isomerase/epimerase
MKYAVCNELFDSMPLKKAFGIIKSSGFSGVEFSPFTIFKDFSSPDIARGISAMRELLDGEGLSFAGLHWLMRKPEGLHLATRDEACRIRSRDHLAKMLEVSGELGGGALVLGSPKQRGNLQGQSRRETTDLLARSLSELADLASACKSVILIEQLSPDQTDVVNTMEEAVALVDSIGSPSIRSMFDFHNSTSEDLAWQEIVEKFYPYIGHVHINEIDGRAPGTGNSDFRPVFEILKSRKYEGWISMEIFEVPEDPESTLRNAMRVLKALD